MHHYTANLSYRVQIFLYSLLLIIIPTTLLSISAATKNASEIAAEYSNSMITILSQASLTLDMLLEDAAKIADMPLLSDDIRRAMVTNYQSDYLSYAQDSTMFRYLFKQTNRLNSNLVTCVFENRYGYVFDYNIINASQQKQIMETINQTHTLAAESPNHTYYAPLQRSSYASSSKSVLPMIKILYDGYDFKEIGVCYAEFDFKPVEKILLSAHTSENTLMIYNTMNQLTFSTDEGLYSASAENTELLHTLTDFTRSLPSDGSIVTRKITLGNTTYLINGCINQTTKWYLLQFADNQLLTQVYRKNFFSHSGIFILSLILGLILAVLISGKLTNSISRLCMEIDSMELNSMELNSMELSSPKLNASKAVPVPDQGKGTIDLSVCGSNKELRKLVSSFNQLNQRLVSSLQQNYQIQLDEQKMRNQMLQFQINHHFLYNTLNVIKSLADIHNIPEIEKIAVCMSDLLRYNLEKFPIAHLEEELQQVNRYLTIQNIRFPGKFIFDCNIPGEFMNLQIPAFILQPLVENSIEHGFSCMESNCYISISCNLDDSGLHLLVADNGCGIPENVLADIRKELSEGTLPRTAPSASRSPEHKHHSRGLRNIHQRLLSHYGKGVGFCIESMPGEGTIIDITIPYIRISG